MATPPPQAGYRSTDRAARGMEPGHVELCLEARDLDRCAVFWRDLLGFEVTERYDSGSLLSWMVLRCPRFPALSLRLEAYTTRRVSGSTILGFRRFSISVPDLDGIVEAARRRGVTFVTEHEETPGRIRVIDPSGYMVELVST